MGYVQVVQNQNAEVPGSEPTETTNSVTVELDHGPVDINVATTDSSEGGTYEIVYLNGWAECSTQTGQ